MNGAKQRLLLHLNGARLAEVYEIWIHFLDAFEYSFAQESVRQPYPRAQREVIWGWGKGKHKDRFGRNPCSSGSQELTVVFHQLKCHRLRVNSGSWYTPRLLLPWQLPPCNHVYRQIDHDFFHLLHFTNEIHLQQVLMLTENLAHQLDK